MTSTSRITVKEIAKRLTIGRGAVYKMLGTIIPAIRVGRRWIVTRHAFQSWEQRCGQNSAARLTDETLTLADKVARLKI